MGSIPHLVFLKYFTDKGYRFNVGFIEDDVIQDETMVVDSDNFDELQMKMKK